MAYVMSHPEAQNLLAKMLDVLGEESDRGIVLLGLSLIDEQLDKLFLSLVPTTVSGKRKKALLDSRGAFGSLSSKLDIAEVCRLLPSDIVKSIHSLRKLRNDLAHEFSSFKIIENIDSILDSFELLQNMPKGFLLNKGFDLTINNFVSSALDLKLGNTDVPMFKNIEELIEYLKDNSDFNKKFEHQKVKVTFAIGIILICSSIIFFSEGAANAVGEQRLIGSFGEKNA
jgi:hypothetical protein